MNFDFTGCYASYVKYDEMKTAGEIKAKMMKTSARSFGTDVGDWFKDEVNDIMAMQETWLAFLIISAIILVIVLLLVIFLRNRIRIAIALIKEASK